MHERVTWRGNKFNFRVQHRSENLFVAKRFLWKSNIKVGKQGGSRGFHLFRNFSKILKSRWKMSLKNSLIEGTFIFSIFIVFLLTNIFNFCKNSLKFQMFKFFSLIFVLFTKSHWKSRWFSKNFFRNFPEFRQPTTSLRSN